MKDGLKLHELKSTNLGLKLPDTKRTSEVGGIAYKMGIPYNNNPHRFPALNSAWSSGWKKAEWQWQSFLKRNDANEHGRPIWM